MNQMNWRKGKIRPIKQLLMRRVSSPRLLSHSCRSLPHFWFWCEFRNTLNVRQIDIFSLSDLLQVFLTHFFTVWDSVCRLEDVLNHLIHHSEHYQDQVLKVSPRRFDLRFFSFHYDRRVVCKRRLVFRFQNEPEHTVWYLVEKSKNCRIFTFLRWNL